MDEISAWLDKWMETTGHDFPVRITDTPGRMKNTTIMRVQILAHICHATMSTEKTAVRICLEQQALREKADQHITELEAELVKSEDLRNNDEIRHSKQNMDSIQELAALIGLPELDENTLYGGAAIRKGIIELLKQNKELLAMTRKLDEHPEGYDGPCECKLCMSYVEEI